VATFAWGAGFTAGRPISPNCTVSRLPTSRSHATTCYYLFSAVLVRSSAKRCARSPGRMMIAGIASDGGGHRAGRQLATPVQLYGAYALIAAGWAGTSLAAINNTLGLWFDRRRGMAISLALNGASCGGVIGVPLLVNAIGAFGFSATLVGAAGVMIALAVPALLVFVGEPPRRARLPGAAGPAAASAAQIRAAAFRSLPFWTVTVPFALVLVAQVGFIVHQIAFLDPLIGRARAGTAVALMTAMAVVGRLTFGAIVDRLDQRKASSASFASQAVALSVMIGTHNEFALFAASALFGFSVGNVITLPTLIVQRDFSAASFGVLVSLVIAICQFTYASARLVACCRRVRQQHRPFSLWWRAARCGRTRAGAGAGRV